MLLFFNHTHSREALCGILKILVCHQMPYLVLVYSPIIPAQPIEQISSVYVDVCVEAARGREKMSQIRSCQI